MAQEDSRRPPAG